MEKRAVKYHRGRLGEAFREEIETLVEGELADPRIGLVSVTAVHMAEDGRSAQVLIDVDGDDDEAIARCLPAVRLGCGIHCVRPRLRSRGLPSSLACASDLRQSASDLAEMQSAGISA